MSETEEITDQPEFSYHVVKTVYGGKPDGITVADDGTITANNKTNEYVVAAGCMYNGAYFRKEFHVSEHHDYISRIELDAPEKVQCLGEEVKVGCTFYDGYNNPCELKEAYN